MEKLLLPDILAKKAEKEIENLWNNLFCYIPLPSTSEQIDNLKWLKLFLLFVLFRLNIEDKKRMLDPNSRKKELSKPMKNFSKLEYMSMFGKPLWFAYGSPEILEKVAKWKLLGGRRYTKYNPDDK